MDDGLHLDGSLFAPTEIAGLKLPNRLVMAPTVVNMADPDGTPSHRQIDYYRLRAEGGVGTIIVEATFVRCDGRMFSANLGLDQDSQIPRFRLLVEAIHRGGAVAGIQLFHAGRRANPEIIGNQPIAPSPVPCPLRQVMPRPLSLEEIEELALSFVSAAQRAHEAGFDLLCLHMAHGYLLHQFITPLANQREDRYGGDEEGRLRLPLEVIKGIRKRLGSRAVISVRISSEDGVEGGLKIEDTSRIAQKLIGAGADLLDVSYGFPGSIPSSSPSRDFPDGCFVPLAEKIKKATGAPVVAVGKIRSLALAEQVLREKRADLVALSRPLLADPELPRKWREGREEEVRRCTADNKGCLERIHQNLEVRCSVNPTLGRTSERQR